MLILTPKCFKNPPKLGHFAISLYVFLLALPPTSCCMYHQNQEKITF